MASNGTYTVNVSVVDNATKQLAKINSSISNLQKPYNKLAKQIQNFEKLSGLKTLREQSSKLIQPLETASKVMAGMFGLGSIAAIISTTRQFASLSNEIQRTAASLGVATDKMQQLQDTGRLLGTGSGSMGSMLQTIQNNQLSMRFGGDGDLQTIYQKLGLSSHDSATKVRNATLDYVNKHLRAGDVDPAILRQLSQKMLGTTNYMNMNSTQVMAAENRAKRLGRYDPANIENANKLRQSYEGVLTAVNGVTQTIIGKLAPRLSPLLDKLANWLAGPQATKVIDQVVDGVMKLADWLASINWDKVTSSIKSWYDWLGGFKGIVEILIGLKLLSWFSGVLGVSVKLYTTFKGIKGLGLVEHFRKLTSMKPGNGMLGFFEGMLGKLTKIAGVLGVIKTGYDLYQDSKITDPNKRAGAYGGTIGSAVGAVAGGVLGSALGPVGTVAGAALGGWAGGKLGSWAGSAVQEKLTTNDQNKRAAYLVNEAMKAGLTKNQAMGLLGNVSQESGLNAGARGDNGSAFGLGQWHMDRVSQIYKGTGIDVRKAGYNDQVRAYLWEMQHGDSGAQRAFHLMQQNQGMSVADAAAIVNKYDERSADKFGQEAQIRTAQAMRYQNTSMQRYLHDLNIQIAGAPAGTTASLKTDSSSGLKVNTPKIIPNTVPTMGNALA